MTEIKKEEFSSFTKDKRNKTKAKIKINVKLFNNFFIILTLFFFAYYIVGTHALSIKGFELQELKRKSMEVSGENKNLELKAMGLKSTVNLSEKIGALEMVKAENIDYVFNKGGVAVLR